MSDILVILWALAIGGLFIGLGVLVYHLIDIARVNPNLPPQQAQVLDALQPFILRGILAAEQLAQQGLAGLDTTITGLDKGQIANSVYDLIPDVLVVAGHPLPISLIKSLVTRDAFTVAVKDAYDNSHAFILRNETFLQNQVDALKPVITQQPTLQLRTLDPGEMLQSAASPMVG